MDNVKRVEVFVELYELIEVYSFKRDQPVDQDTTNFFEKVKNCCDQLNLDYAAFKKAFRLLDMHDFTK